ncbi:DUF3617 domain-containing protein [Halopseudomonas maritima]|uniref:DUF3617 domain-containing protein n=1 Tax=Halopseudomonas maritima TaxID=2918528 RepID=UPI001EEAF480|nr:DUF3617 family protein [Halopseudomonas maritima]UJJ30371.1 DUF3617 domain-containing protein [Halopseudomonas maritima]
MHLSRLALFCSLSLSALTSHANSLDTLPEPGLWISESTTLINGIDMQARMREMRENMLKSLPPEQRAMAEEMLGSEGQVGERQCITADTAQTMADPEALLADARENMPNCDLKVEQVSGDALQFSGQCNDPDGFTGDLSGSVQIVSSREMRSTFNGNGSYALPAGLMGNSAEASDGAVKLEHSQVSRWTAQDCGNTPAL